MKSFHLVLEALATARSLRQPIYISHVVTNESFPHIDEMIRFAKDQRAILYLNPCFSFFGNEGIDPAKAQELGRYFGEPGVIVDPAQLKLIAAGGNDVHDPVCRAVTSTVCISPENKLLLPCYHFKDDELAIEDKLYDLYTSHPLVQQAKEGEGRFSFCNGCTVYCYMRSSLLWRYPVESVLMAGHYVRERVRQRVRNAVAPAPSGIIPPMPVKRAKPAVVKAAPTMSAPRPAAMMPIPPPALGDQGIERRRLPLL
jgi:hypothetical protein